MKNPAKILPRFIRPPINLLEFDTSSGKSDSGKDTVCSLPDLIRYNALHNPNHLFGIQSQQCSADAPIQFTSLTFLQLAWVIERCCDWIVSHLPDVRPAEFASDGSVSKSRPVGLYMESDLGLFIYLASFLTLNIPVSASLSDMIGLN